MKRQEAGLKKSDGSWVEEGKEAGWRMPYSRKKAVDIARASKSKSVWGD
jgi:hypothetical protein